MRLIAISTMVKDSFVNYYGLKENNIDIVYNGVDLDKYHPRNRVMYRDTLRKSLGINESQKVLVFIANNFRLKGLGPAIRTISYLKKNTGAGCFKLLVVGSGKQNKFVMLAKKLNCLEDIVFVGGQVFIEKYLSAGDICFQPTFYDPASLVVLEALASGLPVVTTKYNGMGEIIVNGQEGWVVSDPYNIEELSKGIMFFKNDANLAKCSKAARILSEKYPLEKNYKDILDVYKKASLQMSPM